MKKKIFSLFILLFLSLSAFSQKKITGLVTSAENNTPLPGVNVVIKGTSTGTVTNINGLYELTFSGKDETLVFSLIGMKTIEVEVKTQTEINVKLQEELQNLGEVVVTGYKKINNRVFTGSTSSVNLETIKQDGITDISRMLEGRVAGLNVHNVTGTFGSAPRINIRGGASISGNVQPLWVIDGAVYEDIINLSLDQLVSGDASTLISSAIAGINPTDIEDIQVLKDASASSMYGARALNGVVVISTKSGKRNSPLKVTYSFETAFKAVPSYSKFDLLNSQQTMSIYREMEQKGLFSMEKSLYGRIGGVYNQMYTAINSINPGTGDFYLINTEDARLNFLQKREYSNTNWFNELFKISLSQNHILSLSGGGSKTANYASVGFYNDPGWSISEKVNSLTANVKNTFYISDKLKTTVSLQGNYRKQKAPGTFTRRVNTSLGSFERDFDINPFFYALNTSRTLRATDENGNLEYYRNNWANFNILNEYDNNYMDINVLDFKIQAEVEYRIKHNFKANLLAVARNATTSSFHYLKENSNAILAFRANENATVANQNIFLIKGNTNPYIYPQSPLPHGGILNKNETKLNSYLVRSSLEYEKTINEHMFSLFGFNEIRYSERLMNPFQGFGIQYDRGGTISTNPLIFEKLIGEGVDYFKLNNKYDRGITFSANAMYGYKGKYILNAVFNYEGSNISGKGARSRWLPTWNIGVKWNVDQENYMRGIESISNLSLRLSYGLTAKMNEHAINSLSVYKSSLSNRKYIDDRENEINILHLENRDLTWEKMYEMNLGLDIGFFNNKLSASIDIYSRRSFNLIDLIRTSGIGGQYYKYANFG